MAEAIAQAVLGKLVDVIADAAINEVVFLRGARDKLNSLERELRFIKAFLKDAESRCSSEERMRTWVSEVWDVAYRIEDVVETFVAEVEGGNRSGKVNILKQNLKYPFKLPTVHKLTSEMDKINATLLQIKQCAADYGIKCELKNTNSNAVQRRPVTKVLLPDVDDPNIIGLQKDKDKILNLLLDPNNNRRRVVSIVGQGGLGKTTLARKVYNSDQVKEWFEYRIWLSVSQQYRLKNLLKMMLEKIRPLTEDEKTLLQNDDRHSQQLAEQHFLTELEMSLKQKRYLIIMDDVWTENLWIQIEDALPNDKNSSRVLVTTRSSNIARKADHNCDPYNLSYLSEKESQQLLLKKAFPNQDLKTFPQNLSDLPKKFVERCGGLPLALLIAAGMLSRQPPTYNSWRKVLEKLSWHDGEGTECTNILATSYEDLPFLLKPCFMYFGLFPEDHEIKAKSLIRMWVAEGFIPREDRRTMEETAEDYLEELIGRSMIQVSRRYKTGSIKYCRIHDLMRDLAILKGRKNGFLEIIPRQGENSSSSIVTVRRVALHDDHKDNLKTTDPNLRSLLLFNTHNFSQVERFRLLKILNGGIMPIKADTFKRMVQSRYIEILTIYSGHYGSFESLESAKFRNMRFKFDRMVSLVSPESQPESRSWSRFMESCMNKARATNEYLSYHIRFGSGYFWWLERQLWRRFRRSIGRMRNLETLEILYWNTEHYGVEQLDCVWNIKTLRHAILPECCYGPPSTAHLPNLQTLKVVRVREEWLSKGWPTMPNIRVLKLWKFQHNYGESFHTFLSGLDHLTSLHVKLGYRVNWEYEMRDLSVFPWSNLLESLHVHGKIYTKTKVHNHLVPCAITTSSFPVNLIKLRLVDSKIKEDPMPILEKLESLRVLELGYSAYKGKQLICSAGGFRHLQFLTLDALKNLKEWKADVAEGAMPMLKEITIDRCPQLWFIPGLRHMTFLTKFTLSWGSDHLLQSLREDESHNIKDGQFVHFNLKED